MLVGVVASDFYMREYNHANFGLSYSLCVRAEQAVWGAVFRTQDSQIRQQDGHVKSGDGCSSGINV